MSASPFADVGVVVTGGAGFIGSHLVEALCRAGAAVKVLDDLSTGDLRNLEPVSDRIELVESDIRDAGRCRDVCRGAEFVFHLAALGSVPRSMEDPAESISVNVAGTASVLAAARDAGVSRVVFASSSSVYGSSTKIPKREGEEERPLSPYAASKRMGEELAQLFGDSFGLETVALRFFNVYGPRQNPQGPYAAVVPRFFASALAGLPATIFGDGLQSRDFTFVGDVVAALRAAAIAPSQACGRAYNIGSGRATPLADLELTIREIAGGGVPPAYAPNRPGDVRHSLAATDLAFKELGFRAHVDLPNGLRACLDHYRRVREDSAGAGSEAAGPLPSWERAAGVADTR